MPDPPPLVARTLLRGARARPRRLHRAGRVRRFRPLTAAGNTRRAGAETETRARRHYRLRGYRILGANVWIGGFELDLVARRGRALVFCEVKGKSGAGFGDPLEMVTPEKARRVRRAAAAWLAAHPEHGHCAIRFDVVAERAGKLERIAQAF